MDYSLKSAPDFGIPLAFKWDATFIGSTNNYNIVTFYNAEGVVIARLQYSYLGSGAADNDTVSGIERIA